MGQNFGQPTSNLAPGGVNQDEITWWCRFLARAVGTGGGIIAMALGIWVCVTFSAACLAAGILQIFFGFIVVIFEAPCCCPFIDFVEKISHFSESRPYWQKGFIYAGLGIVPIAMCVELSTFFGSGMIFITGALYGMFALGKKADRETMMAAAGTSNSGAPRDGWEAQLVDQNKDPIPPPFPGV